MAENDPLLDRQVLQQRAEDVRALFDADPAHLLAGARARVQHERRGDGVLDSPVLWFFEAQGLARANESAQGPVVHGYDAAGRLVLIEEPGSSGPGRRTVVEYQDDSGPGLVRYVINDAGRGDRIERVGVGAQVEQDVFADVSIDRYQRWVAYLWRSHQDQHDQQVDRWQIWDSGWPRPDTVTPHYRDGHLHSLVRNDAVIWTDPQAPDPSPMPGPSAFAGAVTAAARQMITPIRRRLQADTDPVLLLTVCFESGNVDYLPPLIDVIYEQDAAYYRDHADDLPDGPDALLNPTLREDYPFPAKADFPYVQAGDGSDLDLPWAESDLVENILRLVDALNAERDVGEPPFLAVDIEGEATQYLDRLTPEDRRRLAAFGLA